MVPAKAPAIALALTFSPSLGSSFSFKYCNESWREPEPNKSDWNRHHCIGGRLFHTVETGRKDKPLESGDDGECHGGRCPHDAKTGPCKHSEYAWSRGENKHQ